MHCRETTKIDMGVNLSICNNFSDHVGGVIEMKTKGSYHDFTLDKEDNLYPKYDEKI